MSYAIGLISGTSLDGCDAALVSIENGQVRPVEFVTLPMEEALRRKSWAIGSPGLPRPCVKRRAWISARWT